MRLILPAAMVLGLIWFLPACSSSTLPSAESLTANTRLLREQAQPEFDALESQRRAGVLSEADYLAARDALEKHISERARNAAWARHSLAQSERRSMGLPTPDSPVVVEAPNALQGGGGGAMGGGSLYRPFTQQSQGGAMGNSFSAGMVPTMGRSNNASTLYVQPAQ
jgi:hypothetical protein